MKPPATFKCLHCNEVCRFEPRSRGRQQYCPAPECRRASKAESQRRWLSRPENANYFRGAENCERVRRWREAHPGYWRKKIPAVPGTLQEISEPASASEVVDKEEDAPQEVPGALQDVFLRQSVMQPALVVGLVSILTGHALQEDIAMSVRSLLDRGEDILRAPRGSVPHPPHEDQTPPLSATIAAGASPVQLDRSAPGA